MRKQKSKSDKTQTSLSTRLATIESIQNIQALERAIIKLGNRINTPISTILTALMYSSVIYYLFTSEESAMAHWYHDYLQSDVVNQIADAVEQPLKDFSHETTTKFEPGIQKALDEVNEAFKEAYKAAEDEFAKHFSSLFSILQKQYQKTAGKNLSNEKLLELLDQDTNLEVLVHKPMIKQILIQHINDKYSHSDFPVNPIELNQMNISSLYAELLNRYLLPLTTKKAAVMTQAAITYLQSMDQAINPDLQELVAKESVNVSYYFLRARFIPEAIGLFTTYWLLKNQLFNKLFPYGILTRQIETPVPQNYQYLSERQAQDLIYGLKAEHRRLLKQEKKVTIFSASTFVLLLGLCLATTDPLLSPLFWLYVMNIAMVAASEWAMRDPFYLRQKALQANIDANKKLLTELAKVYGFNTPFYEENEPSEDYAALEFKNTHRLSGTEHQFSKKERYRLFRELLLHHNIQIERNPYRDLVISLAQPAENLQKLSQYNEEEIIALLIQQRNIRALSTQLKQLDDFSFISIDADLITTPSYKQTYQIKLTVPAELLNAVSKQLPDSILQGNTFSLNLDKPIAKKAFNQLLADLTKYRMDLANKSSVFSDTSNDERNTNFTEPSHSQRGMEESTSENRHEETAPASVPVPASVPAPTNVAHLIKWHSAIFNPNDPNNKVTPVRNREHHYTVCLFTKADCPSGVFEKFHKVITEQPKFVGATGQGLKREDRTIINEKGETVPATRKAKISGEGLFGKPRASAYAEKAPTGEVLHVFTARNIYLGHT